MSLRWFIYQMWACSLSNKWPLHNGNAKSFSFLLSGSSELPNFVCINSLDFLSSVTLCCFFKFHLPVRTLWVYLANKHLSSSTCILWLTMVWIFSKRGNECYYYSCIYILNDQFVSSTPEDFHQILSVCMESLNCFFQIILSFHKT